MKIIIHTDGGARGNPGPAAVGILIEIYQSRPIPPGGTNPTNEKKKVIEISKRIGETTNNVAEYTAVIEALHFVKNNPIIKLSNNPIIQFYLDSNLVVQQLNQVFKVKDANLRKLFFDIRILEGEVGLPAGKAGGVLTYTYVPREQNRRADFLVNKALDA